MSYFETFSSSPFPPLKKTTMSYFETFSSGFTKCSERLSLKALWYLLALHPEGPKGLAQLSVRIHVSFPFFLHCLSCFIPPPISSLFLLSFSSTDLPTSYPYLLLVHNFGFVIVSRFVFKFRSHWQPTAWHLR